MAKLALKKAQGASNRRRFLDFATRGLGALATMTRFSLNTKLRLVVRSPIKKLDEI